MHQESDLRDVILSIYDAALGSIPWSLPLERVKNGLQASAITLIYESKEADLHGISIASGISPDVLQSYNEKYIGDDYALTAGLASPVGTWISTSELFPERSYEKTSFYNNFLRPSDLCHIAGSVIHNTDKKFATVGLHRPPRYPPFGTEEEKIYRVLEPHFARAFQIHHQFSVANAQRATLAELVDQLSVGVVFVDKFSRVVFANQYALDLARDNDGFVLGAAKVTAIGPSRRPLDLAIRTLVSSINSNSSEILGQDLTISRPSGLLPYEVLVAPLIPSRLEIGRSTAVAMLIIRDPADQPLPPVRQLRQVFGLTRAESRFVHELLKGQSVDEVAIVLGISVNTARTHLKRAFYKTNTSRQGELIRRLCQVPATLVGVHQRR